MAQGKFTDRRLDGRPLRRRDFLRWSTGAALHLSLAPLLPPRAAARNQGALETAGLSHPCTVGDVTSSGAIVWLRAQAQCLVSVQYAKDSSLQEFDATPPIRVDMESDLTGKVSINGLEPQTRYYYRAAVRGMPLGPINHFVTAPGEEDAADVQFAFSGDTRESYQPFLIMDSIREMRPDFFLHLGDTIYADRNWVAKRLPQFWAKYVANRNDLPTQRLLSETSVYAVWDDHEVADNYSPDDPRAPIGRKAFFHYWPVGQDARDADRIYRSFRWGKALELFILDTRQYRDRSRGTILGKEQRTWLLESLAASKAWFKMVATPVPFSSPNSDKWGGFPADRHAVLRHIGEKKITGVVFLAADVHYAAVSRVPGAPGLKEFIAGPLGAPLGLTLGGANRFEFFSRDSFSYGMVRVHAQARTPYLEIDLMDEKSKVLCRSKIESPSGTGLVKSISAP
jgi:alkaline phosphatase D